MRLVRRTLLCLVVGVTAFGAAGWGLRPKPNWTTALGEGAQATVIGGAGETSAGDAIWLYLPGQTDGSEGSEVCLDARTGTVLRKIDNATNEDRTLKALTRGRLFIASTPKSEANQGDRVRLEIFDPATPDPVFSQWATGAWQPTLEGRYFWTVNAQGDRWQVDVLDASNGKTMVGHGFPHDRYLPKSAVLLDDRRFVIFARSAGMVSAIEVWDVKAKEVVQALSLPDHFQLADKSQNIGATGTGDTIVSYWRSADGKQPLRGISCDLDAGTVACWVNAPVDEPPNRTADQRVAPVSFLRESMVWGAESRDPFAWHWCVQKQGEVVVPWRRLELAVQPPTQPRRPGEIEVSLRAQFVRAPYTLLFTMLEPPASNMVPAAVRGWLPESWRGTNNVRVHRWHDVRSGAWRDVGCRNAAPLKPHGDAVLALVGDDRSIVESWPLPPRDPKPYSLAVAAICMVATWWLCAWRYRRRMRLASVGAA